MDGMDMTTKQTRVPPYILHAAETSYRQLS
jgi:hypothetical protein